MKIKSLITALTVSILVAPITNAAILAISNVGDTQTDTLYAYQDTTLMNPTDGGIVTIGYFNTALITTADVDTIPELFANLGNFIIVSQFVPGSPITALTGSFLGYADNSGDPEAAPGGFVPGQLGQLTTGNPLIGRDYYSIVTNAASLGAATGNSEFALVLLGQLPNEDGGAGSYTSNPASIVPIIGTVGTFTGDVGFGSSTYSTLEMAVVPEPSAALLGALGAFGLLRRRRN